MQRQLAIVFFFSIDIITSLCKFVRVKDMQNEEFIEKMDIIDDLNLNIPSQLLSTQSKIYRIRKILLILLGILFVSNNFNSI
jgi:hypothetical protein